MARTHRYYSTYKALAELASMKLGGGEDNGNVIELSTLHATLCVADRDRAKQFRRVRKANMKARKKKAVRAATQTAK